MIAIIDYGLGNLNSIGNMCKRLGIEARITRDFTELEQADKLILPGVGHFKKGMDNLHETGLKSLLDKLVLEQRKPILGICLGAQLMTSHSEEGDVPGLNWVHGETIRFRADQLGGLKVPHMGWNDVEFIRPSAIWNETGTTPRFYFVHTYHFRFDQDAEVIGQSVYGYRFACAFQRDNIFGTQFHPEKSHKFGMKVLQNFNSI